MQPIQNYRTVGRFVLLLLLGLAFVGPWFFDHIWVPANYECSLGLVRLEGDFCGLPISFLQYFWMIIVSSVSTIRAVVSGSLILDDWWRGCLFVSMFFLAVLPFFTNLFLLWKPKHRSLRIFNWVCWGLAVLIALGPMFFLEMLYPALWGIWLYRVAVILALVWEGILSNGQHCDVLVESSGALP